MDGKFEVVVRGGISGAVVQVLFEGTRTEVASWLRERFDQSAEVEVYSPASQTYFRVSDFLALAPQTSNTRAVDWETLKEIGKLTPEPIVPREVEQMVPKYYRMDPETEDLLKSGMGLRNGMKVLVGDASFRCEVDGFEKEDKFYRLLKVNRWCTVTELHVSGKLSGNTASFVAVYENGEKLRRDYDVKVPWLVKKDTLWDDEAEKGKLLGICVTFLSTILDRNEVILRNNNRENLHLDQAGFLRDRAFSMVQMIRSQGIVPRELTNEEKYRKIKTTVWDFAKSMSQADELDPLTERMIDDMTNVIISTLIQ